MNFFVAYFCLLISFLSIAGLSETNNNEKYLFYTVYSDIQARGEEMPNEKTAGIETMTLDTVYLAKNEREGFQLFFRSLKGTQKVKVTVSTFKQSRRDCLIIPLFIINIYNHLFLKKHFHHNIKPIVIIHHERDE